jgi:pimeloyl-ACP methyl ester carboxylesterase
MPDNILIKNADSLLGTYLVSQWLVFSDCNIICLLPGGGDWLQEDRKFKIAVGKIICKLNPAASEEVIRNLLQGRLHTIPIDTSQHDLGLKMLETDITKIWCLPAGRYSHRHPSDRDDDVSVVSSLSSRFGKTTMKEFNFVCEAYQSGGNNSDEESAMLARVKAECATHNTRYRIFRLSMVIGESLAWADTCRDGFSYFLGTLHEFKAEIEERLPGYFEFRALRSWFPDPDLKLNLIPVERAVELMLGIATQNSTLGREYCIGSPENILLADLFDLIGEVYDLGLLPVQDPQTLNAIDRSFQERLEEFRPGFAPLPGLDFQDAYRAAGIDIRQALFNEKSQKALLKAIRHAQDMARVEWSQRTASLLIRFEQKTIDRNGSELTYFTGGSSGTVLIFLNALGQGLKYWERLMNDLIPYHRLVIWEPRGALAPGTLFGLQDQVADLEAILEKEKIDACHLVGWCTGPKVAVDFYVKRPEAVLSMVFLNSTFKCFDTPKEFETDYERNFEPLCRVLQTHPNMAPSIMQSLQSTEEEINLLDESISEEISTTVLARMNQDLKAHVRVPFQSASGIVKYAHQVLDFWACDTRAKAPQVKAPILLFSSEYDQVASPEMSRMAVQLFPRAQHVHVRDATHYCLYDRPHFVAEVMERFFREASRVKSHDAAEASETTCASSGETPKPVHLFVG